MDTSYYILVSAQVAQGWMAYFTDVMDSLISGVYYPIAATNFDLSDIDPDPANKTFYVYITLEGTDVVYKITTSALAPYDLYIGKIITGDTQITSIQIVKAVKFGQ